MLNPITRITLLATVVVCAWAAVVLAAWFGLAGGHYAFAGLMLFVSLLFVTVFGLAFGVHAAEDLSKAQERAERDEARRATR